MKIGFIGLGNVGAKLAASLLRHGFDTVVRDLDRSAADALIEQGADWADMMHIVAATGAAPVFATFDKAIARKAGGESPVPVETLGSLP